MTKQEISAARALRVVAIVVAVAAAGRTIGDDPSTAIGRAHLIIRGITVVAALALSALSSPARGPVGLRAIALAIGTLSGAATISVLIVAPSMVLEQSIVLAAAMFGAALFMPWSWRWQAALVTILLMGAAAAVPTSVGVALTVGGAQRLGVTLLVFGLASVVGAGLADRERRLVNDSEARYRSLFLAAGDAIAVSDADGVIREGNPRLAELLGVPEEQLVGRRLGDFYAEEPRGRRFGAAAAKAAPSGTGDHFAALTGGIHGGTRVLVRPDGRHVEVDATFARVDGPTGPVVQTILHDQTDQKAVERRQRQQQRLGALANLAGGIAHQFNNLLGGILTHASVLRHDATQAKVQGELDEILAAVRRGRDLTKELLRFTHNEPVSLRPTATASVLAGVLELARLSLPSHIAIDVRAPAQLPDMAADPDHLVHACLELVLNARDAMRGQPAGRVTITAAHETVSEGDDRWPGAEPGSYVRIAIRDTGTGMDAATRERLFEPFFTTKPMHQAVGLGLARVHRVLRDHRGSLRIESAPREGTTVELLVPVATAPAEAAEPTPAGSQLKTAAAPAAITLTDPSAPVTVLIVDDEQIVRNSLRRALTRFGHTVLEAFDGPTALAALQSADPPVSLVILDLVLPGGGAAIFELLKAVRPDLKVLVSSGYSPDEDQAKALAGRADGFLPKPYEMAELKAAVASALGHAA